MVEDVEAFSAELESETLRQGELLGDGGIEIPSAWSTEHVSRSRR